MKNLYTTIIVLLLCVLLLSCKKDESNPTQNPATGTVQGTITYTGAGAPSASKLLVVGIYPFSNTNMQGRQMVQQFNLVVRQHHHFRTLLPCHQETTILVPRLMRMVMVVLIQAIQIHI